MTSKKQIGLKSGWSKRNNMQQKIHENEKYIHVAPPYKQYTGAQHNE